MPTSVFEVLEKNTLAANSPCSANLAVENQSGVSQADRTKPAPQNNCSALDMPSIPNYDKPASGGYMAVAREVANGVIDEVVNHPGRVVGNVAMGVAVGVGAALVAPEVAVGAAAVGIGAAGYAAYNNVKDWYNSAKTVAAPEGRSDKELEQAKATLQNIGIGTTDIVAGGIAGAGAAFGTAAAKNLVVGSLHSVVDVVETTALRAMTGKMVPYTYYVGASPMSRAGVAVAADQLPQVLTHQGTRKAQSW